MVVEHDCPLNWFQFARLSSAAVASIRDENCPGFPPQIDPVLWVSLVLSVACWLSQEVVAVGPA